MSSEFIMQMRPWFDEKEKNAISSYMEEDGFITEFKRTELFEKMIAEYTNSKHCIVVNNGTISLTLASIACGIERDDDVIVPNYTMVATPNSVKMIGANPVFIDVEPETLCLDIDIVKKCITKKTKALILVSANGRYPKKGIKEFENFCKEKGIILIEDAAQSLGSFYPDGRHIGNVGTVGSFSFSMPKIITTGQGGALITNDDDIAFKLRRLKDFGRTQGGSDIHDSIGYNFKFTELQACIGIEQMKKLKERVEIKKKLFQKYNDMLKNVNQIKLFDHDTNFTAPWFIDCKAKSRDKLIEHLKKDNIGSRVMYPPLNKQQAYSFDGEHPVSNDIGKNGLWLPSYSQLTDQEIKRVTDSIQSFYR
jgi:perosamine synthetase